jgi:hypothetical protein
MEMAERDGDLDEQDQQAKPCAAPSP